MTIYDVKGNIHREFHLVTVVTAAGVGQYTANQNLDIPGNIKGVTATVVDTTVAPMNCTVHSLIKTLPAPAANMAYGIYASQLRVLIYQPDAVARNVVVILLVTVES